MNLGAVQHCSRHADLATPHPFGLGSRSRLPASLPHASKSSNRRVAKLISSAEPVANAATLEATETDLSAELKEILSKVKPKVCLSSL